MMWNELERFVRAHSSTSSQHVKVLECLLDCRRPPGEDGGRSAARLVGEDLRSVGGLKAAGDFKKEVDLSMSAESYVVLNISLEIKVFRRTSDGL